MRITPENIEEVIFEFHEGNLSEPEKVQLMDFLHKHPEYEREFMLWAKSYYHTDKELLDYGNDDKFYKKTNYFPYKWFFGAAGVVLLMVMTYWLKPNEKEIGKVQVKATVKRVDDHRIEPPKKAVVGPAALGKIEVPNKVNNKSIKPFPQSKITMGGLEKDKFDPHVDEQMLSDLDSLLGPLVPLFPDTIHIAKKIEARTLETKSEKKEPKTIPVGPKKQDRKKKIKIQPSKEILPFNSDL